MILSLVPSCVFQTLFFCRTRRALWIIVAIVCMLNFLAIGGKRLWIWRKEKNVAASGIQLQSQVQNEPINYGFAFNNAIHNMDVLSSKLLAIIIIVLLCIGLSIALSGLFIDQSNPEHIALRFFILFTTSSIFRAFICPIMLFITNENARTHVRSLFWNEWAPDFLQSYNPNRVQEIRLNPVNNRC